MEIRENVLLDELVEIFDENNKGFITDKNCIFDKDFLKVVLVKDEKAIGYAVLYFGNDFIENYLREIIFPLLKLSVALFEVFAYAHPLHRKIFAFHIASIILLKNK